MIERQSQAYDWKEMKTTSLKYDKLFLLSWKETIVRKPDSLNVHVGKVILFIK